MSIYVDEAKATRASYASLADWLQSQLPLVEPLRQSAQSVSNPLKVITVLRI